MRPSSGVGDEGSAFADLRNPAERLTRAITQIDQLQAELADLRRAYNVAVETLIESDQRTARVEALCDFAEWAHRTDDIDADRPARVRVDDIRRALRGD